MGEVPRVAGEVVISGGVGLLLACLEMGSRNGRSIPQKHALRSMIAMQRLRVDGVQGEPHPEKTELVCSGA